MVYNLISFNKKGCMFLNNHRNMDKKYDDY